MLGLPRVQLFWLALVVALVFGQVVHIRDRLREVLGVGCAWESLGEQTPNSSGHVLDRVVRQRFQCSQGTCPVLASWCERARLGQNTYLLDKKTNTNLSLAL